MRVETYEEFVAIRLNDAHLDIRDSVKLVDAFRVATGRAEMPREWVEVMSGGNVVERTLWQTDEQLRPPPPVE